MLSHLHDHCGRHSNFGHGKDRTEAHAKISSRFRDSQVHQAMPHCSCSSKNPPSPCKNSETPERPRDQARPPPATRPSITPHLGDHQLNNSRVRRPVPGEGGQLEPGLGGQLAVVALTAALPAEVHEEQIHGAHHLRRRLGDDLLGDEDARVGRGSGADLTEDVDNILVGPVVQDAADVVDQGAWEVVSSISRRPPFIECLWAGRWDGISRGGARA